MKLRCLNLISLLLLFVLCLPNPTFAQSESGSISGLITDPGGAVIPGAVVTVTDLGTNNAVTTKTGPRGEYSFSTLRASRYKISVTAAGFKDTLVPEVVLHTQDKLAENVKLDIGSASDSVTLTADSNDQIETSAAVATTVDRQFIENMPLNGRSFQALIALTPGNVTAKTYYTASGQFSIDGQRTDANYFSIDGVSANVGITQGSNVYLGSAGAGASPATSNNGGYNNMVSVDDMQEYKIQTNAFDAEYGRTPGAQLSIVTRSGTNKFHGTAFEYIRNDIFDANNWFNNNEGLPREAEKQNDFGGVVGGPIIKDKLFFFFSYEGLRLRVPESKINVVPTTFARDQASAAVLPLLAAYPLPSAGQDIAGQYIGQYFATFSNPSTLNASSLRLDYTPTPKLTLFLRGDYAPSNGAQYGAFDFYATSTYSSTIANVNTITAGATYMLTSSLVNDFRFNISHAKGATTVVPIALGGATPPTSAYLFQSDPTYSINSSVFSLFFNDSTTDYYVGNDATNHQRQLNYVDTLSYSHGKHNFKFGVDFRHLTPTNGYRPWDIGYDFDSVQSLVQTQVPDYASVDTTDTSELRPIFNNLSFFAQDSWQVTQRMTINYGIRWDYDPPPSEGTGHPFFTALNLNDPANVALAPSGTPLWSPSKHNFAPTSLTPPPALKPFSAEEAASSTASAISREARERSASPTAAQNTSTARPEPTRSRRPPPLPSLSPSTRPTPSSSRLIPTSAIPAPTCGTSACNRTSAPIAASSSPTSATSAVISSATKSLPPPWVATPTSSTSTSSPTTTTPTTTPSNSSSSSSSGTISRSSLPTPGRMLSTTAPA
jgi:hypothetical protein